MVGLGSVSGTPQGEDGLGPMCHRLVGGRAQNGGGTAGRRWKGDIKPEHKGMAGRVHLHGHSDLVRIMPYAASRSISVSICMDI